MTANTNINNIKILCQNVRSLKTVNSARNEIFAYQSLLNLYEPTICGFTETWLDNNISDNELANENYHVFRKDRLGRGGGLLLNILHTFSCSRRYELEPTCNACNEIMVVEIFLNSPVYIVLFYRPPNSDILFNNNLLDVLDNIKNIGGRNVICMGDLNLPDIEWVS
jgi:exonuclease III